MLIDTHCHLDNKAIKDDFDTVMQRAEDAGVKAFIIPAADPKDLKKAQTIAHGHDNVFFAAGVHPDHADEYDEAFLRSFLDDEKCIAVGECGMDFVRMPEDKDQSEKIKLRQKEVFAAQIGLANEYDKPLIVHIREATDASKQTLLENGAKNGVLHCFNASEHLIDLADHGFYFGIGGVVTFKNAKKIKQIVPRLPLDKIVIETDMPYLTPHPYRGKRNEPSYIPLVQQELSQLLDIEDQRMQEILLQNSVRLFKELQQVV